MHRLFVAIRPPETVRDLLLDLMEGADIRWQENEQLHLTLRFIGEVERPVAEDLADALSKISFPAFALRLKGVGRFDHGRRGALWAGIQPVDEVKALARKIDRACQAAGLKPDRRAYHPHITLARWSGEAAGIDGFIERNAGLASEPWKVGGFLLFESRLLRAGAHYDEILRIHLS